MKLKDFFEKKVHIVDSNGREWDGIVDTYCFPEDNESGNESIILKTETISVEFEESDIESIEVLK